MTRAECAAKRRIVERCAYMLDRWPQDGRALRHHSNEILDALASVYADHPDYRPEWGDD
jgi:hypothetical protein